MLGISDKSPKFCKRYSEIISEYKYDVLCNNFPSKSYSPYKISNEELNIR